MAERRGARSGTNRGRLWRCAALLAGGLLAAAPAAAAGPSGPVDSDLGAAPNGGGCYPTGIHPALLDMLTLVNPEWAPVVDGTVVDSTPVLLHGTVEGMHGDLGGDFPATHLRADVNYFVRLDPEDAGRLGTGNDDGLVAFEWEAGVYPTFAWAGAGDRVVGLGRWIFDCGHTAATPGSCSATPTQACVVDDDCHRPSCPTCAQDETCVGAHFGYSTELHPPEATAVLRSGRGAVLSDGRHARAIPVTRADVFVSPDAGGAGDRCVLQHRPSPFDLFTVECFPLSQPVAPLNGQDFAFDLPLPPRPRHARDVVVRRIERPAPGGVPARVRIVRRVDGPDPHLEVRVLMTGDPDRPEDPLPTGYAGTILAGWRNDPTPLTHVRVTLESVTIRNALQPATPVAPKLCNGAGPPCETQADCPGGYCIGAGPIKAWHLQAAVNGEWQELTGLESVSTGDVIPEHLSWDEYLPVHGSVQLRLDGSARECVSTMYGKSIRTDLTELGLGGGLECLNSTEHPVGLVEGSFPGPVFGARHRSEVHEIVSEGGEGGTCSADPSLACVVDADCAAGDTCATVGGAVTARYRIERWPGASERRPREGEGERRRN